jgi:predicted nicotinamide N-methyase
VNSPLNIIPILSPPIRIVNHTMLEEDEESQSFFKEFSRLDISGIRSITLDAIEGEKEFDIDGNSINTSPKEVLCCESVGLLGIGGKIWDSTFVLLKYCTLYKDRFIKSKHILELGAGTGVLGISLHLLEPQSMVITDLGNVVPLIQLNIDLNEKMNRYVRNLQETCHSLEYSWGRTDEAAHKVFSQCDVALGSDIVYYPEGYQPLVDTIVAFLRTSPIKRFLLGHRHRHPEDHKFFEILNCCPDIIVEEISWKEVLKLQDQATFQDVRLFKIRNNVEC